MSKFDAERVMEAWQEKVGGAKCPMCGDSKWEIQDYWVTPATADDARADSPHVMPVVAGICQTCAGVSFWSAHGLGLL